MEEKEYKYNSRTWRPQPTEQDENSFFHAVFGDGDIYSDKDANFRRRCLLNFLLYFEGEIKPAKLTEWLENNLNINNSSKDHSSYAIDLSSPKRNILVNDIPLIAALENVRIVLFEERKEEPQVFDPEEEFMENYPWKTKSELREVVICCNQDKYTRLHYEFRHSSNSSLLEESVEEDEESNDDIQDTLYYTKLSGTAGIRGILFQINVLTIFLLNGTKNVKSWRLSTENTTAGSFDDAVFEIQKKKAVLLQAKHKQVKKITEDDLLTADSRKDDFSLPKYYLSYQSIKNTFDIQSLTLCTNTTLRKSGYVDEKSLENDDLLYFEDLDCSSFVFNETIISKLREKAKEYKDNNLKDKHFDEEVFSDDAIKEFLSKFQLVTRYPDTNDVIENMLYKSEYCTRFEAAECFKYLNDKMMRWFEWKKGKYLNQESLRVFLAEFRSYKFCQKLRSFQIHLENDVDYSSVKRLLHIESARGYILNMIKIYCSLYNDKCLFLSPNESFETQKEIVKVFEGTGYVTLVACFKVPGRESASDLSKILNDLINKNSRKRIILITGKNDELAGFLKEMNEPEYEHIFENIKFSDLTQKSQSGLLKRVIQFFHRSM